MYEQDRDVLDIPRITLEWSAWAPWAAVQRNARDGGVTPPSSPGVYEAKYLEGDHRLTIGKASNLYMRVKQGLVKGKLPHPAGRLIRATEDTAQIVLRWAQTDRPAAAEEELHRRDIRAFGRLPRHTSFT